MFKRLVAIAALVVTVPVMAYAGASWSLNTWVRSNGGSITITDYNGVVTSQTVANGSVFNDYTTTSGSVQISAAPLPGYTAKYYMNGAVDAALGNGTYSTSVTSASSLASLWVTFNPSIISVTATGDAHSSVNLTNVPNIYYGTSALANINFTFTAAPGYVISSISNVPAGATTMGIGTALAKVTLAKGFAFPSTGIAMASVSAANTTGTTVANAGAAKTVSVNTAVTLTGSYAGVAPAFQGWSSVARPQGAAQPFTKAAGATQTFTPAVIGTYVFMFRTDASTALTSVQVPGFVQASGNLPVGRTCQACHTANGVGDPNIYANYSAGNTHKNSTHSACTMCHNGTGIGAHPGTVYIDSVDPATFLVKLPNINAGAQQPGSEGVPSFIATPGAGVVFCAYCHNSASPYGVPAHVSIPLNPGVTCAGCHTDPLGQGKGTGDAHSIQPLPGCVSCHAVAQAQVNATLVNDNNGVRAITGAAGEFELSSKTNAMGYRSHHIYNGTGVDPQDAQCIACHLEGSASKRAVSVNTTYHMADGKVHLRDGNTALGQSKSVGGGFAWDPANPDHTLMDQFCMSCHNSNGAVTAYANMSTALYGMTPITGAQPLSAKNPFGDLLSNAYDQKVRPAVVAVYDQFNPNNPSHHAVRGQKYSGRTRTAGDPRVVASQAVFTQYSGAGTADLHPNKSGVMAAYQVFGTYSTSGPAAGFGPNNYPGSRKTIYDAGFFVATYTTLDGATLGDDSTLHCGDCHSVGQWKSGSAQAITWNNLSTASGGSTIINTTAVIGAHGSQNEYMLRTSNGSDSLQKQSSTGSATRTYTNGTYVCFLCHRQEIYGDNESLVLTVKGTGTVTANSQHNSLHNGGCNKATYTGYGQKGTARYGVLVNGTATPSIGNLFAMSCAHCHNSGQQNFGGIHGATGTYISYSTNGQDVAGSTKALTDNGNAGGAFLLNATQKTSYRFMGGEGIRYNGGATADKWESQTPNKLHREGCYNLSQTTDATHLWNTTNPATTAAGGTNAIVNNGNGDSSWGANSSNYGATNTDQGNRYASNNTTTGWGSCNHHQGSTTAGPTAPTRTILRPLVY